jgi:hypothetical protein
MRNIHSLLFSLGLLLAINSTALAQSSNTNRWWINFGLGGGSGLIGFLGEISHDSRIGLFTLTSSGGTENYNTPMIGEWGLLYGFAQTGANGHWSLSAGPGYCTGYEFEDITTMGPAPKYDPIIVEDRPALYHLGLVIDAQAYWHFWGRNGIGVTYIQTINPGRTWGILYGALSISLGSSD